MKQARIQVDNLKNNECIQTITTNLMSIDGVNHVQVEAEENHIELKIHDSLDVNRVVNTLSQLGYPPSDMINALGNKVHTYISCVFGPVSTAL
jgi:copper chaperone CopZ